MNVNAWLTAAIADAERRNLPALIPLLEGLAESLVRLRGADFNPTAAPRQAVAASSARLTAIVSADADHVDQAATATVAGGGARSSAATGAPPPDASRLTISEFGHQLRDRRTSALAAAEACLSAIARQQDLNAFILVMADEARAQAAQADQELAAGHDRGPLHGVPISLKDLIDVRGTPTTAASRVRAGDNASIDAAAVIHLRQAGAVIVGKTNLHEFAFGTTNEDSGFGLVRHPRDPRRSPGGSSGGSAVSVAADMALGSIGTDTGGSIRIPAAACGLVGLKGTLGEVATDGVLPLSATMDHLGPIARTVTDAWLLHNALLGKHARPLHATPISGLRIGVLHPYFCDLLEPPVANAFAAAAAMLAGSGATCTRVRLAHADVIASVYLALVFAEAAAYHAATLASVPALYTEAVRLRLELARYLPAEDYRRALAGRETLRRELDAMLSSHDVLLLPTLPIVAPPLGEPTLVLGGGTHPVRALMLRLTQLFNITGHPAVTLPCGADENGLPVGLQVVGRRHETDVLMHAAASIEMALAPS